MRPISLNKLFALLAVAIVLCTCAKSPREIGPQIRSAAQQVDVRILKNLRVEQLLITLFSRDFTEDEWTEIFNQTNRMSINSAELSHLSARDDAAAVSTRDRLIAENIDSVSYLADHSSYLMLWSLDIENCFVSETLILACHPSTLDNPLNGGLPTPRAPLEWRVPDPIKEDIKTPYLYVELEKNDPKGVGAFKIVLRLKAESLDRGHLVFKGDAIPDAGSSIRDQQGKFQTRFYPYGYAELSLVP